MKNLILTLFIIVLANISFAQTNTYPWPSTGHVGIGVATPGYKLHVFHDYGQSNSGDIAMFGGKNSWSLNDWEGIRLGFTQFRSIYEGSNLWGFGINTGLSDGIGVEAIRVNGSGNVGIGTTSPTEKLVVNGKIRAKEIKVETGWADFVFKPDYKLLSLKAIEKYIKTNGHLPEIPSAKEVEENGINLGEMNAKLLQKIEELTLHLIEMNKTVIQQQLKIEKLESKH